jgi:hypothetical protein
VQRNALLKKGGENRNMIEILYIVLGLILPIIIAVILAKRGRGTTTIYSTNPVDSPGSYLGLADPYIASSMYNSAVYDAFSHRDNPPSGFR